MKLIGIIGKSGSGKTTLAKMLQKDDTIAVIHLDKINDMKEIKKRMPNSLVNKEAHINEMGEEFMLLQEDTRRIIEKLKRSKLFSKIYLVTLHFIRERLLNKEIREKIREGKKIVLIERIFIGKFFSV